MPYPPTPVPPNCGPVNAGLFVFGSIYLFKIAITGWDNFIVDGKAKPFKKEGNGLLDEEAIEVLPLDIIEEVANHILKVSKFPEEEKGK